MFLDQSFAWLYEFGGHQKLNYNQTQTSCENTANKVVCLHFKIHSFELLPCIVLFDDHDLELYLFHMKKVLQPTNTLWNSF